MKSVPMPLYITQYGAAYVGNAMDLLKHVPDRSVDLVLTSPPFALQRQKEYGNVDQDLYVDWLLGFCTEIKRVLRNDGSFVLDLGGAYRKGRPVRSLYNYRILIKMCDELGWNLAEEFFWFNPSKLPSPIEWVNKRKIRVKDAVNTIWWFSKTDFPKADIKRILVPYSDRMMTLLQNSEKYYKPKKRPSGHEISKGFGKDNGGAIPPNLLEIPNTESNSQYLKSCKMLGIEGHPARFPQNLPEFFIQFLTEPGDRVLDIFAGSNTTGAAAEHWKRKWMAFEMNQAYLAASSFRFIDNSNEQSVKSIYCQLIAENTNEVVELSERAVEYRTFLSKQVEEYDGINEQSETTTLIEQSANIEFTKATINDLEQEYQLAHLVFGEKAEARKERKAFLEKNSQIDFHLYDQDKLVAYINVIPLKHEAIEDFIQGRVKAWDFSIDNIEQFVSGKPLECIIIDMVTTPTVPPNKRTFYGSRLLKGLAQTLEELGMQGIEIMKIYSTSSSPIGIHMLKTAGFQMVHENQNRSISFELNVMSSDKKLLRGYQETLEYWKKQQWYPADSSTPEHIMSQQLVPNKRRPKKVSAETKIEGKDLLETLW